MQDYRADAQAELWRARDQHNGRTGAAAAPETLFFVHIPKCAGSSFRQVLKRWFGPAALFLDTHDEAELKSAVRSLDSTPLCIGGHIPFGLHQGLGLRPCYVSLVRHPLDRFVSFYKHAGRVADHPLHAAAAALDLRAFYDFTLEDPRARNSTIGVQCYFLSHERSFEAAREVIDSRYALLAPTQRYDDFVAACAERFGHAAPQMPARNVSDDLEGLEGAREGLRRRVESDHAEDLRLHDYVTRTFDARRGSLCFALHA